jgi:hypothetical protein
MAAKPLPKQIEDLKAEISRREKEAAQCDLDAERLSLADSEAAVKSASRAAGIRAVLPLQRKGLVQLVAQLVAQQIAEAEAEIDREVERKAAEKAKDFPTLRDRIYALGRAYNDLAKHPDAPRLLDAHPLLSPDAFRSMVEGAPAFLDEWRAADRKGLADEAAKAKAEARRRIASDAQDLLDNEEEQPLTAAEVSA